MEPLSRGYNFDCKHIAMNCTDPPVIVADVGTWSTKVGFNDNFLPCLEFPTVFSKNEKDYHIGEEALLFPKCDRLCTRTLGFDYRTFGDIFQQIWNHIYEQLNVPSQNHAVLVTHGPLFPKAFREVMAQILFEEFQVPAMRIYPDSLLSLYSTGNTFGTTVDCGYDGTCVTPIYDGYCLPHAVMSSDTGGVDLDIYCKNMLISKYSIDISLNVAQDIKEKLGTAILPSSSHTNPVPYQLPDGNKINIGEERYHFIDPLFDSSLVASTHLPIQALLTTSIQKCDNDIHELLSSTVVLAGGHTMWPGMGARLEAETKKEKNYPLDIHVIEHPDRLYSAWIGGTILTSLKYFNTIAWSLQEYDESGPGIIHPRSYF